MITSTGWGWEQARSELDIPRLKALTAYWQQYPPTHVLVKGFAGYKPASPAGSGERDFVNTGTSDILSDLLQREATNG